MNKIEPISIPTAAALPYGNNDVRHFSEGDALDVPGVQSPTRYLAQRDVALAEKVNELVSTVNNQEQMLPLPLPRIAVGAAAEEAIANYRIPPGFEARIINATVATSPFSSDVELRVLYSQGYGNSSGTEIVSTATEYVSGSSFYNDGELIVLLRNTGATELDCIACVTLTLRPIGAQGSLLVGSVIQGQQGQPGQKGDKGEKGDPGTGGPGSPGLVWRGAWLNGQTYNAPTDVVSFQLYGTVTSSYVTTQTHVASGLNQPPNTAYWDLVAEGSSGSVVGTQGPQGPAGAGASFSVSVVTGTLVTGADWVSAALTGYDDAASSAPSTTYGNQALSEYVISSGTTGGLAFLQGSFRLAFRGHGTLILPTIANGASCDYTNSNINLVAAANGTQTVTVEAAGTLVQGIWTIPSTTAPFNAWVLKVLGPNTALVNVGLYGVQPLP